MGIKTQGGLMLFYKHKTIFNNWKLKFRFKKTQRFISLLLSMMITLNSSNLLADDSTDSATPAAATAAVEAGSKTAATMPDSSLTTIQDNGNFQFASCALPGQVILPIFTKTSAKYKIFKEKSKEFTDVKCAVPVVDSTLSSSIPSECTNDSTEGTSKCNQNIGTQSLQTATEIQTLCSGLESGVESAENEVLAARDVEREKCKAKATELYKTNLCGNPPKPDPVSYAENIRNCEAVAQEVLTKSEKLLAFAKKHWMVIAGLLTAVLGGGYALMHSSKKQAKDLKTDNGVGTDVTKPVDVQAVTTPTTITLPPAVVSADTTSFERAADQPYCQSTTRPIECFVTPACDLTCAAKRYGLSDYAGMGMDTRRIDSEGKITDPTTARSRNPGSTSSNTGGGSGGGKSGSGGPGDLSGGNTEVGTTSINTRGSGNFSYDSDGYGGGARNFGYGNDSDNGGRNPASTRSINTSNPLSPQETGPLHKRDDNLFTPVSQLYHKLCVQDQADCG